MSAEHTPTPWERSGDAVFAGDKCLALLDTESFRARTNQANAAFIVKACNAHDALYEASKTALWRIEVWENEHHEILPEGDALRSALELVEAQS